ncbi:MAG: hypothetical protein DHS20C18_53640 [Saprospiraceae bacterium]|nr:MAG: hypothetical protein DHS20C18_53640 [Saprospiraceae bacterium]
MPSRAQTPFICKGDFYLVLSESVGPSNMYAVRIDPLTDEVIFEGLQAPNTGVQINAMGYRVTDNFIYGVHPESLRLYQIDSTGTAYYLGVPTGNLNLSFNYFAGDITPDGRYLVIIGSSGFSSDGVLVHIDLEDPNYSATSINITGPNVRSADIAFDPTNGRLYGYDGNGQRLVEYDPDTGVVSTNLGVGGLSNLMGGLFFDAFGNLYGYGTKTGENGQQVLFSFDKNTGSMEERARGPIASRNDACSCPYTIKLREWAPVEDVVPCTEVPFLIEIANTSGQEIADLILDQTFPQGFTITAISNLFGGTISAGGPGTNFFVIENMTIPLGISQIEVLVTLEPNASGTYQVQALLHGLPASLGESTLSDNPYTIQVDDPATITVSPLEIDFSNINTLICPGDQIDLSPSIYGVDYLWSDGSTEPAFTITEEGTYGVTISSGCDVVEETINVQEIQVDVELGQDITIELGDFVSLHPQYIPPAETLTIQWSTTLENSDICLNCENQFFQPLFDGLYTVDVSNGQGCNDVDSVMIFVLKNYQVYAPNVFSPNDDGINDRFFLQSKYAEELVSLQVFDRWGNIHWDVTGGTTNDARIGWDGKGRGKLLDPGVFVYRAVVRFLDGIERQFSGSVTLVR